MFVRRHRLLRSLELIRIVYPISSSLRSNPCRMLDSLHMMFLQSGKGFGDGLSRRSPSQTESQFRKAMRSGSILFSTIFSGALLFAVAQSASSLSQGAAPSSNQSNQDCSDPLLATTAECTAQNQQNPDQTNQFPGVGSNPGSINSQLPNGMSAPGQNQPRGINPNYPDLEPPQRQLAARAQTPAQAPPEPLTDFQKFIATTTGQILPIYGANLFRNVPSTFAPVDMAPVPSEYVIGPGDELRIRVWGQVNFQANIRVDRSGEVYIPIPQVGPVHVAGLTYAQLDQHLRDAIARVYRNFDLLADVGQIRAIQVYLAGEARRPGAYTVSSLSTLVDALFAAGGPSVQGSLRHIELRRNGELLNDFDLYAFLIHGDKSKDARLLSGDVIYIPPVGPQAAVTGSVRSPGIYELRESESVGDLVKDAGGASTIASQARISIERIQDHNQRQAMEVAFDSAGLSTVAADGDLVRVFSIVPRYAQTVTLRGNIANPGRFAWHAGMRVSDLIPDKDSLLTRDYWWKRAQMGLPSPEFEPTAGFSQLRQTADNGIITLPPPVAESNRQYNANQSTQEDLNGQLGLSSQLGTSPQSATNGQPTLTAGQRGSNSSLAEQQSAGSSRYSRNTRRNDLSLPGPEIDWDYAVILRLDPATLKTNLISFDLGKLVLQHDASQNLELQPGDIVTIFSEADIHVPIAQQTKLVRLEGEFVHAGLYTVNPGETLRSLVQRVGGLTPNAYLYGSEFTRESTRAVQQARIDEYVQSLDMRIQRSNLAIAASPVGSAQDLASGAAAQSSERELINRLRLIRATGRIVLEFKPANSDLAAIPDLPLEDGDRFVIPSVPASINIVGAVNDQNSFLYTRGRRVGTYLQKAGGITKDADRKRSFLIRADGEVVGYDAGRGLWSGDSFNNLRIYPGDTIVVPEKAFKPSALRGVLDWSQLFSQFALGAASLSVLH